MGLNSQGFNVNDRRETWLFQEIQRKNDRPVYRRLKFNVVQYGDDPEEFLEPANASDFEDLAGFSGPIDTRVGTEGRAWGFRFLTGKLCEVHAFDDFDAAGMSFVDTGRTPTGF